MVFWCGKCGRFIGLREPLTDWTVNRNSLCSRCAEDVDLSTEADSLPVSDGDPGPALDEAPA
jgi:hypothetical protein